MKAGGDDFEKIFFTIGALDHGKNCIGLVCDVGV